MPTYQIELTEEQVEGIKEMVIKDMPDDCPIDPKGFIEWLIARNVETRKRDKLMRHIEKMDTDELEKVITKYMETKG